MFIKNQYITRDLTIFLDPDEHQIYMYIYIYIIFLTDRAYKIFKIKLFYFIFFSTFTGIFVNIVTYS